MAKWTYDDLLWVAAIARSYTNLTEPEKEWMLRCAYNAMGRPPLRREEVR